MKSGRGMIPEPMVAKLKFRLPQLQRKKILWNSGHEMDISVTEEPAVNNWTEIQITLTILESVDAHNHESIFKTVQACTKVSFVQL